MDLFDKNIKRYELSLENKTLGELRYQTWDTEYKQNK